VHFYLPFGKTRVVANLLGYPNGPGPEGLLRSDGDWNVYVRMTGVNALYDRLFSRVRVVEHLHTKNYGCIEFAIEDPNGFRLVFSEKAPPS
jgi:hypothetical protein